MLCRQFDRKEVGKHANSGGLSRFLESFDNDRTAWDTLANLINNARSSKGGDYALHRFGNIRRYVRYYNPDILGA